MDFKELAPEIKEKALACTTADELIALAKETGIELSDEELESISGGINWKGTCSDYVCQVVCSAGIARIASDAGGVKSMM